MEQMQVILVLYFYFSKRLTGIYQAEKTQRLGLKLHDTLRKSLLVEERFFLFLNIILFPPSHSLNSCCLTSYEYNRKELKGVLQLNTDLQT